MGYLDENPEFHHQLLLARGDALWLVRDDRGAWALPGFVSAEAHTAEVDLIARHMRERFGVRVVILGRASTEHDPAANRVRKADLAEPLAEPDPSAGRWWSRAQLAAGEAGLADDSAALVRRWAAGEVGVADDTPWSRHGWHAAALDWIASAAGPIGEVEQVRVSEFSTVLRVEAGGKPRYFKSVAKVAALEPAVTAALARRSAHLPPVIAVDPARRFILMEAFAGEPLAAPEDIATWCAAARAFGELQRECLDAVDELRAIGCHVASAASLHAPLATLLADRPALLANQPEGLSDDQIAALHALAPELAAAAAMLDAGPLPLALEHGDLWPGNVLVGAGGCAFVDWEDVRIGHPFLSLFQLVTGAHLDRRFADHDAAVAAIRDAYVAGWSAWGERAVLERAFDAAHDIAAISVANLYYTQPPAIVEAHPWMREMPAFSLGRILARRAAAAGPRG
ncbi:MAG TPA: phosphotransferase [Kofleriaceae bacterium]|nr:phosphotransferase [Kofleriaceae bacterium]